MPCWHVVRGRPEWHEQITLEYTSPQDGTRVVAKVTDMDGDSATWEVIEYPLNGEPRGLYGDAREFHTAQRYAELVINYGIERIKQEVAA